MNNKKSLVEKHIPALRRYAVALTYDTSKADDLVQDCLERALRKLHLWQAGSNLKAWLFTIMHNLFINTQIRLSRLPKMVSLDAVSDTLKINGYVEQGTEIYELTVAVSKLPVDQKNVILLVGLEGFGYKEVSNILGIPLGTVMSRLHRAREKLRSQLYC